MLELLTTTASEAGSVASEEPAGALQGRLALFSRAWIIVSVLGLAIRVAMIFTVGSSAELKTPSFYFHVAHAATMLPLWLVTRTGSRSVTLCRVLESATLAAAALTLGAMGRALDAYIQTVSATDVSAETLAQPHAEIISSYVGLIVVFALLAVLVIRAAIVPSTWQRTLALCALTGATAIVVLSIGNPQAIHFAAPTSAYWLMATAVATVVSHVIHGLREQVQSARRLGQYTLEGRLGEGGMGVVYRARHAMLRRPTAVKLLPANKMDERAMRRFEREVQLTAELAHPNTVTVYDYGRTEDGVFYYAMELLTGASVEDVVAATGPQSAERVVHVLASVCGALSEAHSRGLIHRDIKPANIMLSNRPGAHDVVKIVDFGLVKRVDVDDPGLSRDGTITGTPLYMAPESLRDPDTVDGRTDLYALGGVAYYLLTGRPPFEGRSIVEVCGHHLHSTPDPIADHRGEPIPADLEALVRSCLEKDPIRRPDSAEALERALRALDVPPWTAQCAEAWWRAHAGSVTTTSTEEPSLTRLTVNVQQRM